MPIVIMSMSGKASAVFWAIGLAMCFYEPLLFKIRISDPVLRN